MTRLVDDDVEAVADKSSDERSGQHGCVPGGIGHDYRQANLESGQRCSDPRDARAMAEELLYFRPPGQDRRSAPTMKIAGPWRAVVFLDCNLHWLWFGLVAPK